MKIMNIKHKTIITSLLAILLITSCDKENGRTIWTGSYVEFDKATSSGAYLRVNDGLNVAAELQINLVAAQSSSDNMVTVEVDAELTTAIAGVHYVDLVAGPIIIPANSSFGVVPFEVIDDNIEAGETWVLAYKITGGSTETGPASTNVHSIQVTCPSDLAGTYDVVTTYGYHDFLPAESTWTIEAEITEVSPGVYSVDDFSGGLYSVGAYSSAYGTTGQFVTFSEVCGAITWSGQTDAWGPCVPQAGKVNAVAGTGVITISWLNEEYGENGVSVYTPK